MGCAEASKAIENGGMCHTQVCRYARPGKEIVRCYSSFSFLALIIGVFLFIEGNCNLSKYMTTAKDWWLEPMLMDFTPCGPACPSHGCH